MYQHILIFLTIQTQVDIRIVIHKAAWQLNF